jgi:hypothetical protein
VTLPIGGKIGRRIQTCKQRSQCVGNRLPHDLVPKSALIDDYIKQLHAQAKWIVGRFDVVALRPMLTHLQNGLRMQQYALAATEGSAPSPSALDGWFEIVPHVATQHTMIRSRRNEDHYTARRIPAN